MSVSYESDFEPFCQNEIARKLSYKYEIENQEKSLSQAKCPISLTPLYVILYNWISLGNNRTHKFIEPIGGSSAAEPLCTISYGVYVWHLA